jgi:hypothetical protein
MGPYLDYYLLLSELSIGLDYSVVAESSPSIGRIVLEVKALSYIFKLYYCFLALLDVAEALVYLSLKALDY